MVRARANIRRLGGGTSMLRGALVFRLLASATSVRRASMASVLCLASLIVRVPPPTATLRSRELASQKRDEGRTNASQERRQHCSDSNESSDCGTPVASPAHG